jgi:hypothetical protein
VRELRARVGKDIRVVRGRKKESLKRKRGSIKRHAERCSERRRGVVGFSEEDMSQNRK